MKSVQEKTEVTGAKKLAGKVALVTGGSRGIGAAIALRLAQQGAAVAISFAQNKSAADQVVAKISEQGCKAVALKSNVSSESEAKNLIEEVSKSFGPIDILVNNAGVFETMPIDQIDLLHYQRVFDVNVKGVVATTVAAIKKMQDGGRIINISSGAAKVSIPGASIYSATKAALETLTRIWAQELGKRKITVNAVAPGTTVTDMLNAGLTDDMKQMMVSKTALGRLGEPEDIAAVVAFLASEDGRWVTGQSIGCDGGLIV
jgi:3-oxoacyl-[acyl-carrier protein] reductase